MCNWKQQLSLNLQLKLLRLQLLCSPHCGKNTVVIHKLWKSLKRYYDTASGSTLFQGTDNV